MTASRGCGTLRRAAVGAACAALALPALAGGRAQPVAVVTAVPPAVYARAMEAVRCDAPKAKALIIADMRERNTARRLWVVDLRSGEPEIVFAAHVAHGSGSDPKHTGYATVFGNAYDSSMTSLGAYHIAEQYVSHGSVRYRLDGMSPSNYLARPRNVVLHQADYVKRGDMGWSEGCIAVSSMAMAAMQADFGTLTGGLIWVDGPGVVVPKCVADSAPWLQKPVVLACSAPTWRWS